MDKDKDGMIAFIRLDDPVYSVIKFMEANSRDFQALRRVDGGEVVFGGYNISGGGWCGWLQGGCECAQTSELFTSK